MMGNIMEASSSEERKKRQELGEIPSNLKNGITQDALKCDFPMSYDNYTTLL